MPKSYKRRLKQAKKGEGFLDKLYDTSVPAEPTKKGPGMRKKKRKGY